MNKALHTLGRWAWRHTMPLRRFAYWTGCTYWWALYAAATLWLVGSLFAAWYEWPDSGVELAMAGWGVVLFGIATLGSLLQRRKVRKLCAGSITAAFLQWQRTGHPDSFTLKHANTKRLALQFGRLFPWCWTPGDFEAWDMERGVPVTTGPRGTIEWRYVGRGGVVVFGRDGMAVMRTGGAMLPVPDLARLTPAHWRTLERIIYGA